jgi:hypothetical protein
MKKKRYKSRAVKGKVGFLQSPILGAVVLLLVIGCVVLAAIDSSTRPMFVDLTKTVVLAYIGLHIPYGIKNNNSVRPRQLKVNDFLF